MRYYQPPQQQVVRIGNPQQQAQNVAFHNNLMNQMYQGMMKAKTIGMEVMKGLGDIQYFDQKAYDQHIVPLYNQIDEALQSNLPALQMIDVVSKANRNAVPFIRASNAQIEAIKQYDNLASNLGDDVMFGRDPRNISLIQKDGSLTSPEAFQISYYRPSVLDAEMSKKFENVTAPQNKWGQTLSDPKSGETYRQMLTVTGMPTDILEDEFNPNSPKAIEKVTNRFKTNENYAKVWLDKANGNIDEALKLATEDAYIRANNTLRERVTGSQMINVTPSRKGKDNSNSGESSEYSYIPPEEPAKRKTVVGKTTTINIPESHAKVKADWFDGSGNIGTFKPEKIITYIELEKTLQRISEYETILEDPNAGFTEEDFTKKPYIKSDKVDEKTGRQGLVRSPMTEEERAKKIADRKKVIQSRLDMEKQIEEGTRKRIEDFAKEYKPSKEESEYKEYLRKVSDALNLDEIPGVKLSDEDKYNIIEDMAITPNEINGIDFGAFENEDYNVNRLYGTNIIGSGGEVNFIDIPMYVFENGKIALYEKKGLAGLAKVLGIPEFSSVAGKEKVKKQLELAQKTFIPVGGPFPGAIELAFSEDKKIYIPSNPEVAKMLEFAHSAHDKAMKLNFESSNIPQVQDLALRDDDGNIIGNLRLFPQDTWKISALPQPIEERESRLTKGKKYPGMEMNYMVEITKNVDADGNKLDKPKVYQVMLSDLVANSSQEIEEYLYSDKTKREWNKYMKSQLVDNNFYNGILNVSNEIGKRGLVRTASTSFKDLPEDHTMFVTGLLDFIAQFEGQDYNRMMGQNKTPVDQDLSKMTLAELIDFQQKRVNQGFASGAAGRYQIITPTLKGLISKMKLDPNTTYFTPQLQDEMGFELLKDAGIINYLAGDMIQDTFMNKVAAVWSSLPLSNNKSVYEGDKAGNKALTTRETFAQQTKLK